MSETTLFITAHPDDLETMLAYAALDARGEKVAIVASNGTASHKNYTHEPGFCHAGKRRHESEQGLQQLGFTHQYYLELPDSLLARHEAAIAARVLEIARAHNVTRFLV
jgi:LmbE family N-acetylglucosaminyl deacetylase